MLVDLGASVTQRIVESACPKCAVKLDAVTPLHHRNAPKPGDLTVCFQCATVLRFDESLHALALGAGEFKRIPRDVRQQLENAQRAIRSFHAIRKATN